MTNGQNLFQFGGAALFGGVDEFPPPVIDVVTADHFKGLAEPILCFAAAHGQGVVAGVGKVLGVVGLGSQTKTFKSFL